MPDLERVPTDVVADDLVLIYQRGVRRLEGLVGAAIRRGLDPRRVGTADQQRGDASLAYRTRQLRAASAVVGELDRAGRQAAITATTNAYGSSLLAIDRTLGAPPPAGAAAARFGGLHRGAIEALAGNLDRSLANAARQVGRSLEIVFERAAALNGPLGPEGLAGVGFIGRRADDPWRRLALEELGTGQVALSTRRQISAALVDRLQREGVTDALTGFVDRAGRRWSLDTYAELVARTTTREATSRATVNRLGEHGVDLVSVSSHPHRADSCTEFDGRTFALPGTPAAAGGAPVLARMPPFHPRCRHVLGPAGLLDTYERELGIAAADTVGLPADDRPTSLLAPPRPPAPPLSPRAAPAHDAGTADRLEDQRIANLIAGDPGPEPGAREALLAIVDAEEAADLKRRSKALDKTLGPELTKFLNRKWARERNVRGDLLAGRMTIDEAEDLAVEEWHRLEEGRVRRAILAGETGELRTKAIPCFVCGRFKRRPADICDYCGDDPVTVGGSAESFNRNYGYAS